ncbi:MAG: DNA repair protein RecO [Oscillospiraceae bacterium]|nr:DNA repair protein RecO [Oscillospiraceae bacterium]MDY4191995.1 DNA repair protein RecO [Oscillospiraceae bacterium]
MTEVTPKRMQMTDEAVVIRERSIGEDDKLLTLLCRREGVITAYARGAKKMKSTLGPSCGLLAYSSFQLFHSKDRYIVDRADTINLFFGLRQNIEKLSLASYLAEAACVTAPTGRESEPFLRLVLNCLHFLEKDMRTPQFIKPVFELRSLAMSGFMPDLVACSGCGCYEAEEMFFSPLDGTLWCGSCAGGPEEKRVLLPPGVLAAMRHIIYCEFEKLFSFRLPEEGLRYLGQVCERYFLAQMGQSFQTLDFYHSLSGMEAWAASGLSEGRQDISAESGE